jgi:hypothetical protein
MRPTTLLPDMLAMSNNNNDKNGNTNYFAGCQPETWQRIFFFLHILVHYFQEENGFQLCGRDLHGISE